MRMTIALPLHKPFALDINAFGHILVTILTVGRLITFYFKIVLRIKAINA